MNQISHNGEIIEQSYNNLRPRSTHSIASFYVMQPCCQPNDIYNTWLMAVVPD